MSLVRAINGHRCASDVVRLLVRQPAGLPAGRRIAGRAGQISRPGKTATQLAMSEALETIRSAMAKNACAFFQICCKTASPIRTAAP